MDIDHYMKKPPNSYKAPSPDSFKPPAITYEGFRPCSPPKCRRVVPTTTLPKIYRTTTPHHSYIQSTKKFPPIYRTTTTQPSYTKPTENVQQGFLVDYHSDNDISNSIDEKPNLCTFTLFLYPRLTTKFGNFYNSYNLYLH